MSKRVQLIRGITGVADAFTGKVGEITADTTKKELRLHDGLTAGGVPHARADLANVAAATASVDGKMAAADKTQLTTNTATLLANSTKLAGIEEGAEVNHTLSELKALLYPTEVANHVRAGHTQIWDGLADQTPYSITSVVTEGAFETVGPTDSGADNIWSAMDVIPSTAKILLVSVSINYSPPAGAGSLQVYFARGGGSAPSLLTGNRLIYHQADSIPLEYIPLQIPLGLANQDFHIAWQGVNDGTPAISLIYRGFIAEE